MHCHCCNKRVSVLGEVLIIFRIYWRFKDGQYSFKNICYVCGKRWYWRMKKYGYYIYSK